MKVTEGDSESIQAGEYKDYLEGRYLLQNRHHGPAEGPAGRGREIHPGDHHPPLLRGMRAALESTALLLILTLCLLADGIMDSFGPGGFAAVSAATLAAAAALEHRRRAKRKAPCTPADQSEVQGA